jgi:hypothetical protein
LSSDISKEALDAAKALLDEAPSATSSKLNETLSRFVGPHFKAGPASIIDAAGATSLLFQTVVYRSGTDDSALTEVRADQAAAVIDVYDELNVQTFRDG